MSKLNKTLGFTLIELLLVILIMSILSAIAIPTYKKFSYNARESEARESLGVIKSCQESYKAEYDHYLTCSPYPATVPAATSIPWNSGNADFFAIGFDPSGNVRYQYSVFGVTGGVAYSAQAEGNLDGDATNAIFLTSNSSDIIKTTPDVY